MVSAAMMIHSSLTLDNTSKAFPSAILITYSSTLPLNLIASSSKLLIIMSKSYTILFNSYCLLSEADAKIYFITSHPIFIDYFSIFKLILITKVKISFFAK